MSITDLADYLKEESSTFTFRSKEPVIEIADGNIISYNYISFK